MDFESVRFKKFVVVLTKIAAAAAIVSTLVGIGLFYLNNIYKPSVSFKSIDVQKGVAYLEIMGKEKMVYLDTNVHVIGDWAIQVTYSEITAENEQDRVYNRIELLKNGVVYGYIPINS